MKSNKIKLVVFNENALGYIFPEQPKSFHILSADVKSPLFSYSDGSSHAIGKKDVIRLANESDFDKYRVSLDGYRNDPQYIYDTSEKMAKGGSTTDPETQKKIKGLTAVMNNETFKKEFRDKAKAELERLEAKIKEDESKVKEEVKTIEKKARKTKAKVEKEIETKLKPKPKPKAKTTRKAAPKTIENSSILLAKEIRKEGEAFKDAMSRAGKLIREAKEKGVKVMDLANKPVHKKKVITSAKRKKATETPKRKKKVVTSAKRKKAAMVDVPTTKRGLAADKAREALPVGKRVSKGGSNQYGKSEGGNIYYEYRRNRADRSAKRKMAKGGEVDKSEYYIWNRKNDASYDTNEKRFYDANWEIDESMLDTKSYLQGLIDSDPEKFENCVVKKFND